MTTSVRSTVWCVNGLPSSSCARSRRSSTSAAIRAVSLRMPTHEELARARDYVTDTLSASWHRLVRMIMHFQHDVLRKDG